MYLLPSSPPGIIQPRSDLTLGTVFWVHSKLSTALFGRARASVSSKPCTESLIGSKKPSGAGTITLCVVSHLGNV